MKKIGFIDFYLSEWHANNYPQWIRECCEKNHLEYEVAYAWGEEEISLRDGKTNTDWCRENGVTMCSTIEECCEKSDVLLILAPSTPEKHLPYAKIALSYKKPTYIDKTFAPDLAQAKEIFSIAAKYGTPVFSTSALRYADELKDVEGARSLITTGDLYGRRFCYETLPMELDPFDWEAFETDPTPFWVTCTRVATGEAEYFLCGEDRMKNLDIFCASASMPLVSRKVILDGKEYLDGGLADSVPLGFMEKKGFERNVVILTQPRAYRKERSSALALSALLYGKKSALYRCLETRHERYNAQREEIFRREREGRVLVIAPDEPLPVGRIEKDAEKLRLCHRIGYETAKKQMDAVKAFLL
ncbi:MAG: patatin-like phospholipase family protein [Clostridia bacterium]|nr:patatin-like phospholipase family protein [Clostridia bacterium]